MKLYKFRSNTNIRRITTEFNLQINLYSSKKILNWLSKLKNISFHTSQIYIIEHDL